MYFVVYDSQRRVYWAPAAKGYTSNLIEAGAFTQEELPRLNTEEGRDEILDMRAALQRVIETSHGGRRVIDVCLDIGDAVVEEIGDPDSTEGIA